MTDAASEAYREQREADEGARARRLTPRVDDLIQLCADVVALEAQRDKLQDQLRTICNNIETKREYLTQLLYKAGLR